MKPTFRVQPISSPVTADTDGDTRDVSGLIRQRNEAIRALEQTREARKTGEIEKAAATVVDQLEKGLTGEPEIGPPGVVTARVVASGDSKARQPAVPLAGLIARLKVGEEIIEEKETNQFGLVSLELPKSEKGSYELEVLGPNCNVIACQKGRWGPKRSPVAHRIELGRSEQLKPQLERAARLEEAIKKARERADIARGVVIKALDAQERKLIEYLSEIDEELKCNRPTETEHKKESDQQIKPRRQAPRQPEPAEPVELQAPPKTDLKTEDKPKSEEESKTEDKPKTEDNSKTEASPQGKHSETKQRRTDKEKKSM
jgi:hypothetical protein